MASNREGGGAKFYSNDEIAIFDNNREFVNIILWAVRQVLALRLLSVKICEEKHSAGK